MDGSTSLSGGIELDQAEVDQEVTELVSDSDSEELSTKPRKITQRRRAQNTIFQTWLATRVEKITKEEIKTAIQNTDDEILSIRSLMSKQESNVIITDPREYQIELFERAKTQNIIAVLDTGSGKTLIAVLLLKHVLDKELEHRAQGKRRRIAFFLVDCVTLVFQQFAVLECNLNQKIDRFCGDMNADLWNKSVWNKHFEENMAIVCTAEVLYNCLLHSFISMDQINLLIFDEAHHAKKNHGYARIIKDFYLAETDLSKRPKIFGMTASPVDAKVDVVQAAKELETLLHCQIATTADLSLLRASVSRPNEGIIDYEKLPLPYMTPLCSEIAYKYGDMEDITSLVRFSEEAASQLGEWCADQIWAAAFTDEEALRLERSIERAFMVAKGDNPIIGLDLELLRIRKVKEIVKDHAFPQPVFDGKSISSKVSRLKDYLSRIFEKPSDARCIVFVKQRFTARLLCDVLKRIGNRYIRPGILIGSRGSEAGDSKITFRQQVLTLMRFRKGELNCLFATSIAEEGLDIPDCNTVIRFDLYDTLIQYIQSRGRARHMNSRYIHMIEHGNRFQIRSVKEVQDGEKIMRQFCESLPADRLLHGNDYDLEDALIKERLHRTYTEPSTGAKLTYGSSLMVLAHFVGCLPNAQEKSLRATYHVSSESNQFVCEVILPEESPIHSVVGRPSLRRAIAKRSAAFEACVLLRKKNHLDKNLLPIYQKQLPAMRNAHLALNMHSSNKYEMRVKPSCWEKSWGSRPQELYLTVVDLDNQDGLGRLHSPLALLTRSPMPNFPRFPLHLRAGSSSEIVSTALASSAAFSSCSLTKLTSFTLRVFQDVFNKTYEVNEPQMSYWLAPIKSDKLKDLDSVVGGRDLIDWPVVDLVHDHERMVWKSDMPHVNLEDRFFVDEWDGGRRFFSLSVVNGLCPFDPVPEGYPTNPRYQNTIMNFSSSLYPKARALREPKWDRNQPVILAQRVLHRRNLLDNWDDTDRTTKTLVYICPEPLFISCLPTSVASTCYILPAIIHRFEAYLIALEACKMLNLEVDTHLALEALTKDSDNTEDHRSEQIHVQRGMGRNYERLEFIGDCFLKMATSISLYAQNARDDEFESHVKRMLMICNKNMFNTAIQLKLYEYIRSVGFSRRTWYPEGIKLLRGKGINKTGNQVLKHDLNDKTIADVCEALIGAALLSYEDTGNMDMAVRAVTTFVNNEDHSMDKWEEYYQSYKEPDYLRNVCSAAQRDLVRQVREKHDYEFKRPFLLVSAFTHPSCPFNTTKVPSYQRLEFLGDSLLDMACVNFLFYRHPNKDPQWLTEHKMAMVSNKFFGSLSVKLGFHKHLRLYNHSDQRNIADYVRELEDAEAQSQGARDYWTTTAKNPPKCLPDILEAYVGAIFVDSYFSYAEVSRFFDIHIRWYFEDMYIYDTFANNHPTVYLSNLLTISLGCTDFKLLSQDIPSLDGATSRNVAVVMVHDRIIAEGEAASSKYSKIKASSAALKLLQGLAPFEYRSEYGCECKGGSHDEAGEGAAAEGVGSAV